MHNLVQYYDCPILNIGQQKGDEGYINFISERALGNAAAMKGVDCIGREFLALRAELVYESGSTVPTFSTFYQKYVNNKSIWQCFNYTGMELLPTSCEGLPINDMHVNMIQQLLTQMNIERVNTNEIFDHHQDTMLLSLRLRY